ncbi:MAG: hypothetical protein U5N26_02385 [Candidatus Marinimicrobia bacterium]|nr:hypothetical protein [Candidatus Neomarinimicrobiota bacterium]
MRRFKTVLCFFLLAGMAAGQIPDTLRIAPCDEAALSPFGDIITLSRSGGILRRYQNGKLLNTYSGSRSADKFILQDPVRPVPDGADKIHVLDAANNRVLAWDRFLNLHFAHTTAPRYCFSGGLYGQFRKRMADL